MSGDSREGPTAELTAVEEHIALNNAHPKPFEWHAYANLILAKVAHCKEAFGTEH